MRIGLDLDGLVVDFIPAYQEMTVSAAGGVDLFKEGDNVNPPTWNWPELRGYDKKIMDVVWQRINASGNFWANLKPMVDNVASLVAMVNHLENDHEVYYITSRDGKRSKRQAEWWLRHWVYQPAGCDKAPTVLLVRSHVKGEVARALRLNVYVEDNWQNAIDTTVCTPNTRTYLLNRLYNTPGEVSLIPSDSPQESKLRRVDTLGQVFDREIAEGHL